MSDGTLNGTRGSIAFLSGAPRISLRAGAVTAGPRAHVLGVMGAFERMGFDVDQLIIGDRMPASWSGRGAARMTSGSRARATATDFLRLAIAGRSSISARTLARAPGTVMAYERLALFHGLGRHFQRQGVPWVLETNQIISGEAKDDRQSHRMAFISRGMEGRAYEHADAIVAVSENLRGLVSSEFSIDPRKILVVPNAVDLDRWVPTRPSVDAPFTVGFVGGLIKWNATDLLIEAVADLREDGIDVRVVIVGDGPHRAELETAIRDRRLTERVEMVGGVPWSEVPAYVGQFHVGFAGYMPPSAGLMYGSPTKLYEYMAMSCPVVASDCADSRALIEEGASGFLFEAGDRASLKGALVRAFSARAQLDAVGQRARAVIEEGHTWDVRITKMMDDLASLLNRPALAGRP